MTPHFLILTGDGIHCAAETQWAFELAGGETSIVHINDLLQSPSELLSYDGLALPGGFSFGDDLGAGQIMALKLRYGLGASFHEFVDRQSPIIGICNGFQILTKLGVLPNIDAQRTLALAPNVNGRFINRWVNLHRPINAVCRWTSGVEQIALPIRHAEGRVVFREGRAAEMYQTLWENGQVALQYTEDVNGSYRNIAGITDPTGTILGLMPHPEAYLSSWHRPDRTMEEMATGDGLQLFQNIIGYLREKHASHSFD